MKYEKGDKITFVEATKLLDEGKVVYLSTFEYFYKLDKDKKTVKFKNDDNDFEISRMGIYDIFTMDWYKAKEVEEKFVPKKEQLLGWWYDKRDNTITRMNDRTPKVIADAIKEGCRPITPEQKNKLYEDVLKELNK